jgi:trimeric autotransporter adhesin
VAITTGCQNTAVGACALLANTEGVGNVAIGFIALDSNTTSSNHTAVGSLALCCNTTGCCNTGIGFAAFENLTTGINNIALGFISGSDAVANISSASNNIVIGNTSHTCARIKIAWTVTSDARDKTCIDAVPHGLCFVKQLNPISFFYKKSREKDFPTGRKRYGFKAQDILPLEQGDAVIISDDEPENLKYNESSLIPVLVNAIKELAAENNNLKSRVEALENKS